MVLRHLDSHSLHYHDILLVTIIALFFVFLRGFFWCLSVDSLLFMFYFLSYYY